MRIQFVKFILVGVLNTLFGYSVYSLFVYLNVHYAIASLISTLVGVLFNFKSIGLLVFNNSSNKLLLKFCAVYGVVYLINLFSLSILKNYFNLYVSAAMLVLPLALVSFFLNRKFVFK